MKLHWGGKLVTAALVATLALGAAMDANAKRIGGGSRSFGKQSSTVTQRQQTPPTTPAPTQQQAAPTAQPSPAAPAPMPAQQPRRNWGAMLGGLARAWASVTCCPSSAWAPVWRRCCRT